MDGNRTNFFNKHSQMQGSMLNTSRNPKMNQTLMHSPRGFDTSRMRSMSNTNYRDFDTTKRTNEGFRFTSNQRERIDQALLQNSRLESTPTRLWDGNTREKLMNLRPREKDKEVGPPSFRFKPNNFFEKVADRLRINNANNTFRTRDGFDQSIYNLKTGEPAKNLAPLTQFNSLHKTMLANGSDRKRMNS